MAMKQQFVKQNFIKPYVKRTCKYEGKDAGRRSMDAKELFGTIIEGAKKEPAAFAGRVLQSIVFESRERNKVTITPHSSEFHELQLHCDRTACPNLRFGKCQVEPPALLPENVSDAVEKAWRNKQSDWGA